MAVKRTQNWEASDFCREFKKIAVTSPDEMFREKFGALAAELEPLEREFIREKFGCGGNMDAVLEEMQHIAARSGYCSKPRGFERDCQTLYQEVDQAIAHLRSLREGCFV
jgi:hypothetical protein